jgi:GAF domain-containing protein
MIVAAAVDEEHLALIRSIGMRSALVVPLLVRGRNLGALTLVHAESGRHFDEADLAFAGQVATTAAVALDNARRYQLQHRIADTLQAALLPAALPVVPGLRLAARYRAQATGRVEDSVSRVRTCTSAATSTTSCPARCPGAGRSWWPTSAARARKPPRSRR